MTRPIATIEGAATPTDDDIAFMEFLDDLADIPTGGSFGLLLFKGDPIAFRMGRDEWLAQEQEGEGDD